jgi:hypothetical protein
MQIKTALRFHITPFRIVTKKQKTRNTSKDAGRKKEPLYSVGGNVK